MPSPRPDYTRPVDRIQTTVAGLATAQFARHAAIVRLRVRQRGGWHAPPAMPPITHPAPEVQTVSAQVSRVISRAGPAVPSIGPTWPVQRGCWPARQSLPITDVLATADHVY